jgi:predicted O-methyltransferase YrrM
VMDPVLQAAARSARGFMPDDEGRALYDAAVAAAGRVAGRPLLEVGTYCAKSAVYLGAAARRTGTVAVSVDHHRGSEENQAGWEHHDAEHVDARTGRMDTLPFARRTLDDAGLDDVVVLIVGASVTVAAQWSTPLALLFIDGGHGHDVAWADYRSWTPKVAVGGTLAIHDVFPDPADGGRPPYELYLDALASGAWTEEQSEGCGSLRVLHRSGRARADTV